MYLTRRVFTWLYVTLHNWTVTKCEVTRLQVTLCNFTWHYALKMSPSFLLLQTHQSSVFPPSRKDVWTQMVCLIPGVSPTCLSSAPGQARSWGGFFLSAGLVRKSSHLATNWLIPSLQHVVVSLVKVQMLRSVDVGQRATWRRRTKVERGWNKAQCAVAITQCVRARWGERTSSSLSLCVCV